MAVTRWRTLDPLLPSHPHFSVSEAAMLTMDKDGRLAGLADVREKFCDVATLEAMWGPLEQIKMRALVAPSDSPGALDRLLKSLAGRVRSMAHQFGPDSCVTTSWPSRDERCAPVLASHNLHPYTALAIRTPGRTVTSLGEGHSDVIVRWATHRDIERIAELWLDLVTYDASFGAVSLRPKTASLLHEEVERIVLGGRAHIWIAERNQEPVGFVKVSTVEESNWINSYVAVRPAVYLGAMSVSAKDRGAGVGLALANAAHEHLDTEGVKAILLHYALANPLAAPFWSRVGYRPLWTTWRAQPVATFA
jgi:predicted N-acetyltransferase YhbS